MNDNQLDNLKQFIDSRFSQTEFSLNDKIELLDNKIEVLKVEMNHRFDEIQSGIAETITVINDTVDDQLKDHPQRIAKLERQSS